MTIMIRDEVDIIRPMLEHHLAEGIDMFVVTDNGSVDGTTEILEEFVTRGVMDLRHDPVHLKQQGTTVTGMARDAYTEHGATWVVNADADEFWVAVDRGLTLREAFGSMPPEIGSFVVPVIDMTGAPAMAGSGLSRLRFRDTRPINQLRSVGLHAHSTPNSVHVGTGDIEVSQGNHFVNLTGFGVPSEASPIEVLHLPWRSWNQFSAKVEKAGLAYAANTTLTPSPNHHGMREWERFREGTLFAWYLARHPSDEDLASGRFYAEDERLVRFADPIADVPVPEAEIAAFFPFTAALAARERDLANLKEEVAITRGWYLTTSAELESLRLENARLRRTLHNATTKLHALERHSQAIESRTIVRVLDRLAKLRRRP